MRHRSSRLICHAPKCAEKVCHQGCSCRSGLCRRHRPCSSSRQRRYRRAKWLYHPMRMHREQNQHETSPLMFCCRKCRKYSARDRSRRIPTPCFLEDRTHRQWRCREDRLQKKDCRTDRMRMPCDCQGHRLRQSADRERCTRCDGYCRDHRCWRFGDQESRRRLCW